MESLTFVAHGWSTGSICRDPGETCEESRRVTIDIEDGGLTTP